MFNKNLLLQHISNRQKTIEEQNRESDWEAHKQLAADMRQGEEERRQRGPQRGDHEYMAQDIRPFSDKEFRRYQSHGFAPLAPKDMDHHINKAAEQIRYITDAERKHHEESGKSSQYKGWLKRGVDGNPRNIPVSQHIDNIKRNAFMDFATANRVRNQEELADHMGEFNRRFNDATRRDLEHPLG